MARMIPPHISDADPSTAERLLFDTFQHSCPADWIVLHSLDIARRGTGPFGEADFVVIAPGFGILVIEAKTYLARTVDGQWITSPTSPPHDRSPFRQASNAMHRILDWLDSHSLPSVLAASVVIVPDMEVRNRDQIEWAPWQLIDRSRYHSKGLDAIVCEAFDSQRKSLSEPPPPISQKDAALIVKTLRGEIESYISPRARIEQQIEELRHYTDEQFQVLDQLGDNPRLLIDGLAGTGKTLLAIESVRRAVNNGQRVLFLCFNRLLSSHLVEETSPLGELCTTSTIHDFMQQLVGDHWSADLNGDYWEQVLPDKVFDRLSEDYALGRVALFDEIVIDEAQDILVNWKFLMVLDSVLAQKLENGRWRFFGDFQQQDIFGRLDEPPRRVLENTVGYQPPLVRLRTNCRNLPRIAHLAESLAFSAQRYDRCRRDDDGLEPRVLYYDGAKTARKMLHEALETLSDEGFAPGQIVVLSRRNNKRCLAATLDTVPWRDRLRPLQDAHEGGYTGYDSIFRFKGLEAPAVVVTDIDPLDESPRWSDERSVRSLLYVASTRALSRVVLLVHKSWQGSLDFVAMDETGLNAEEAASLHHGSFQASQLRP